MSKTDIAWGYTKIAIKNVIAALGHNTIAALIILIGRLLHSNKLQRRGMSYFRKHSQPRYMTTQTAVRIVDAFSNNAPTSEKFYDTLAKLCNL